MGDGLDLLRMLEPVVRPGGLPGPARAVSTPIEARSFDSLLDEAKQINDTEQTATANVSETQQAGKAAVNPLSSLSTLDRIENATLRQLLSAAGGASRQFQPGLDQG